MTEEQPQQKKRRRWPKRLLGVLVALVLIVGIGFGIYVGNYSHADSTAIQAMEDQGAYAHNGVRVEESDTYFAFVPDRAPKAGFIFYPGGKVQAEAYAPLMQTIAQHDILCVVCTMPFNLAVFNLNAANGIQKKFPEVPVGNWYIGGHSLGGAMASVYAADHCLPPTIEGNFKGLILLGAYASADLKNTPLRVLLIHGENDGVMNKEKYEEGLANLPADSKQIVIAGGNHAQFGDYGEQDGDGKASISAKQQQAETADAIVSWIGQ